VRVMSRVHDHAAQRLDSVWSRPLPRVLDHSLRRGLARPNRLISMSRDTALRDRPANPVVTRPSRQELRWRAQRRRIYRRRRIAVGLVTMFLVALIWLAFSLEVHFLIPLSVVRRISTRRMGAGPWRLGIVNWIENEWYSHHPRPSEVPFQKA